MHKSKTGLALAAMLAAASSAANASDSSGLYVAVQGGLLNYDTGSMNSYYTALGETGLGGPSFGNSFSTGDFVGYPVRGLIGYQFNSRWAVEASGLAISNVTYSASGAAGTVTATSKMAGSSVTLVSVTSGGQPGDYLSLLLKLGAAAIRSSSTIVSTSGGTMSPLGNGNKIGLTYGVGLLSDVTDNLSLRFDWDSYRTPANASSVRFNTWMFGAGYKF